VRRAAAGNCYVNRNMIGAVVGVQPFGGHGLSGTGPKAGGPLYLRRLLSGAPAPKLEAGAAPAALGAWCDWLAAHGFPGEAGRARQLGRATPLGVARELPGPVGERNTWALEPRGRVLCIGSTVPGVALLVAAALATGNHAVLCAPPAMLGALVGLPEAVGLGSPETPADAVLFEGDADGVRGVLRAVAGRDGAVVPVFALAPAVLAGGDAELPLAWLLRERSVSVNTAAAGGNASLMTLGA
jgi:RHH-type proline utilization regulon transcriptional repressor/proline dehydrogenase/delta 1-pyrroline-5-carboxylate dehydrogenase